MTEQKTAFGVVLVIGVGLICGILLRTSSMNAQIPVSTEGIRPSYSVVSVSGASAASKDYLNIFNASGSGRIVRLHKLRIVTGNTAAVAGVQWAGTISRTSDAGATCSALTIQKMDSANDNVPAQITASHTCTTDPTVAAADLVACAVNADETAPIPLTECYSTTNSTRPIVLREGEGVMLKNNALAPVGLISAGAEISISLQ